MDVHPTKNVSTGIDPYPIQNSRVDAEGDETKNAIKIGS
jgi:hypothetical protein